MREGWGEIGSEGGREAGRGGGVCARRAWLFSRGEEVVYPIPIHVSISAFVSYSCVFFSD